MEKKKNVLMTIVIFVVGLIITGASYAFWSWNSTINKNVVFNTANNLKNYIVYNEGESAFTGELNVSNNYQTGGIHSTISIYKTTNVNLLATIHMDINQIGENMKNSPALKWVVTEGTTSNVGAVLAKGNFIGTKSGDVLTLVPDINVTTTETFYTIWIWLDSSANPSDNLSGETLDTNVWTEINQVEGSEDRYEITNTTANYQQISATVVDSKYKVTHYAITTTNSEPTSWTTITPETDQAKVYNLNTTVNNTGTYYIWFKDTAGRTRSREIEVTKIDKTAPSCNWSTFTKATIQNNETSQITLTCIDNESGISVHNLKTTDIIPSNNKITVTNINKENITNGYKYTITVTGTNNDGTSKLVLSANLVKNGVGLGNASSESDDITVANTYTVKYQSGNTNCNLDNTTYADKTATYGTPYSIANPSCAGYTFNGWTANNTLDTTNAKYGSSSATTVWSNASTPVKGDTQTYFNNLALVSAKTVTLTANWNANTLTFNNQTLSSGTYGSAYTSNAFDAATNGTGSYTYTIKSGAPSGATINSSNRTISFDNSTAAGTYSVVVTATDANSGKIKDATMTITIGKASSSISLNPTSGTLTYGTNATSTITKIGDGTLSCSSSDETVASCSISGTTLTITPKANTADNKTATIKVTIGAGANYNANTTGATYTATVNRKLLTCPDSPSDKTYNGTSQGSGITCPSGSTASGTQSATNASTDAYTQTCTASSGYKFASTCSVTWKINKKAATITAKDQSINYGSSIATGTGQITSSGLISGHSVTAVSLAASTTDVTTNGKITPSGATIKDGSSNDVTSNYAITYTDGKLTISSVNATCPTLTSYSGTYDGNSHTITVGTNANGGTVQYRTATSGTESTWSTTKPTRTDAGTTTVYVQVAGDTNHNTVQCYTSGTTNASIAISAKTLTVPSSPSDKTYNGTSQGSGITCPSGSTASGTQSATNASTDAYTQTCTLSSTTNYKWNDGTTTAKNITWKINPKSISVIWSNTGPFTYNGNSYGPTASVSTGVTDETMTVEASKASAVGTHTSTATCKSVSGGQAICTNYTLTNATKSFTISYNSFNITLDNANATTNGTSTIYMRYSDGVYLNNTYTTKMTTSANPIATLPQRTGYTFAGYYDGSTQMIDATGKITSAFTNTKYSAAKTLNAHWTANTFNITLDNANAEINGAANVYEVYADGVYLESAHTNKMTTSTNPIPLPERTGYTFAGYYDGSTQMIDGNGYITSAFTNTKYTSVKTLNAHWTANSYTITLDNEDATTNGTATIYEVYADGVYLESAHTNKMTTSTNPITIPQRTGYTFTGYYDGSTQMIDGDGHITSAFTNTKYTSNKTLNIEWIDNVLPTGTISATYANGMITATISAIDEGSGLNDSENYGWSVSTDSTCDSTITFVDDTSNTYSFNTTTIGTHYVCVRVKDNNNNVSYISEEVEVDYAYYQYAEGYQLFTAPENGYYFVETWGAQGGDYDSTYTGGKGGYSSGYIYLTAGEELYVYVGKAGETSYNAGDGMHNIGHGGGATDVRYFGSTPSSADLEANSATGLNSRIMVAGGGGGAYWHTSGYGGSGGAGGGNHGGRGTALQNITPPWPAHQTAGGAGDGNGTFGYGGTGPNNGGDGYYGGGASSDGTGTYGISGSAGGSSFISGYAGVDAITSSRTHTDNTLHYSGKYFIDNTMTSGTNSGDGKAKITYVGSAPARVNEKLNGVRYVRDCINGNSKDSENDWVEFQVIKNGVNIAKGITVTGIQNNSSKPLSRITDGEVGYELYAQGAKATGYQCIIIDLGDTYDVDEIAVWHYYIDNRTFYENTTYVSGDNAKWEIVMQGDSTETSNGKHVNVWEVRNFQDGITYSNIQDYQMFAAPVSGYYFVETWGAQGGDYDSTYTGGKGGYSSGYIYLTAGEKLYVYVGKAGETSYNAGDGMHNIGHGGGATDVRYFGSTPSSADLEANSATGLNSRIMVAGGGGGAYWHTSGYGGSGGAGGGIHGGRGTALQNITPPWPAHQTAGGAGDGNGTFGYGGTGQNNGGDGYYGGGASSGGTGTYGISGSAGGSSFISGYAGVDAITSSRTHTDNTLHYSGKYFIDNTMISGNNSGDGKAKVTYVGGFPERVNYKLNNVRYVRDCMNGSSNGSANHWVELQVIKDGINIAKGIQVTGITNNTSKPLSRITDGDITSANYAEGATATGNQCIILDLGAVYQVDEIAVWHYWSDGRTYNSNVTSVSSDGTTYTTVIEHTAAETANGKRINAWFIEDGTTVTITYDANGGTGAPSPTTYAYDSSGNSTTNLSSTIPTRAEHTFLGWARFSAATTPEYAAGEEWNRNNKSKTLYAVWGEGYICQAGTYLRHGETACVTCPAGYGCAGGTFDYDEDNDQGITQCRAGTFSAGGQGTCLQCTAGSYSTTDGATSCTACSTGTTSAAGSTSANACTTCTNNSNVTSWNETSWNANNTMTNLCSVKTCATNYTNSNNKCVYRNYTKTTTTCIYTSTAASSSIGYEYYSSQYVCADECPSLGGTCQNGAICKYTVYSCSIGTLASNHRCYYTTTESTTTTTTNCTPQTQFSSCTYDNRDKVNITCT